MIFRLYFSAAVLAATALAAPCGMPNKLQFFGINESGPEYGESNLPGAIGKDYIWPDGTTFDTFIGKGMNIFRVNVMMERMVPNQMTGSCDKDYMQGLQDTVNEITDKGAYAIIAPHNSGRYYKNIVTDCTGFEAFWKTVAGHFASNDKVIFDTSNEYHDMDQELVVELNQAAINGIRSAGATTQWITPEGNDYTAAKTWREINGPTMGALKYPFNMLMFQMHLYLDNDGSGTHDTCDSGTVGVDRITAATQWLRDNNKVGIIGEFAAGANSVCRQAVEGLLQYLNDNSDVWMGALWWNAGPWVKNTPNTEMYNMEPSGGTAYKYYFDVISQYM